MNETVILRAALEEEYIKRLFLSFKRPFNLHLKRRNVDLYAVDGNEKTAFQRSLLTFVGPTFSCENHGQEGEILIKIPVILPPSPLGCVDRNIRRRNCLKVYFGSLH